jgi:hypothetical protein
MPPAAAVKDVLAASNLQQIGVAFAFWSGSPHAITTAECEPQLGAVHRRQAVLTAPVLDLKRADVSVLKTDSETQTKTAEQQQKSPQPCWRVSCHPIDHAEGEP